MPSVTLHDKEFILYLDEEKIQSGIAKLAKELVSEYSDKDTVFIGVLNGCFRFVSDVMKYIDFDTEVNFIKLSSYRGTASSGKVSDLVTLNADLLSKHVVILEDIVDTGRTVDYLMGILEDKKAASVKIATLLYKPDAFLGIRKPDFSVFEIPNLFVIGYGLDYDGLGRNLNDIYQIKS